MVAKRAWPAKQTRAFSAAKTRSAGKSFHLDSIMRYSPKHASAFKTAAEMVIDTYESAPRNPYRDELFYPVANLYRHCLELKFKDLVRLGVARGFFAKAEVRAILGRHNLLDLWEPVRRLLEDGWRGAPAGPLDGIESVVKQFHKADPDGQCLRYERTKSGKLNRQEKLPRFIRLSVLKRSMDGVYNLLDTCEGILQEDLENRQSES